MNDLVTTRTIITRCPACQLQICKSREQRPHSNLRPAETEANGDYRVSSANHTLYQCQTCSVVLIHSSDMVEPGWRQQRR